MGYKAVVLWKRQQHVAQQGRSTLWGLVPLFDIFIANSELYFKVATSLTLVSNMGSIATKCKIKLTKNQAMPKTRNCLSNSKGVVLMQVGKNPKDIMRAMEITGGGGTNSLYVRVRCTCFLRDRTHTKLGKHPYIDRLCA